MKIDKFTAAVIAIVVVAIFGIVQFSRIPQVVAGIAPTALAQVAVTQVPVIIATEISRWVEEIGLAIRPTPVKTPPPIATKPTPTLGPPVTATLTPTPGTEVHDPTIWHDYSQFGHGHGQNPLDCDERLNPLIQQHMDTYGGISYPWQTPNENSVAHNAYFYICVKPPPGVCQQVINPGDEQQEHNCIDVMVIGLHSDGSWPHDTKPVHSYVIWGWAYDPATGIASGGVFYQGGQTNYGYHMTVYNTVQCENSPFRPSYIGTDGATVLYPNSMVGLPPYINTSFDPARVPTGVTFWSGGRVESNAAFFPGDPNFSFRPVWKMWNTRYYTPNNQATCANAAFNLPAPGSPAGQYADIVQILAITIPLSNFPATRPLSIWTDQFGHPNAACTSAGPIPDTLIVCSPFVLDANVPANGLDAFYGYRTIDCNQPNAAPCVDLNPGSFPISTPTMMPMPMP